MNKITLITESAEMTQDEFLRVLNDALTSHEFIMLVLPAEVGMETSEYYEAQRARVRIAKNMVLGARFEVTK